MNRVEALAFGCVALGVVTAVAAVIWFVVNGGQVWFRRVPETGIALVCATGLTVVGVLLLLRGRSRATHEHRRR